MSYNQCFNIYHWRVLFQSQAPLISIYSKGNESLCLDICIYDLLKVWVGEERSEHKDQQEILIFKD